MTSFPAFDGSSEEAFESSHKALQASLTPEQKLKLSLALLIVLRDNECAKAREPFAGPASLTRLFGGQLSLKACRRELHGLSYDDVMLQAYPDGSDGNANDDT